MCLTKNDEMIHALAPDRSDQPVYAENLVRLDLMTNCLTSTAMVAFLLFLLNLLGLPFKSKSQLAETHGPRMHQRNNTDNEQAREQEPDPDKHDRFDHDVPPYQAYEWFGFRLRWRWRDLEAVTRLHQGYHVTKTSLAVTVTAIARRRGGRLAASQQPTRPVIGFRAAMASAAARLLSTYASQVAMPV